MSDIFDSSTSFAELGLRRSVLKGVEQEGFTYPTHIQAQLIPLVMQGHDVLGQAKTGTGKTAAFGLPILHHADPGTPGQALILAPTRELAAQIVAELDTLGRATPIRAVSIVGGESYKRQLKGLKGGAHILVGTPGRVMDLMRRGQITLNNLRWVVLDEVDRMLDIGFRDDIRRILSHIRHDHQTVFVSATISEEIERLARRHMRSDVKKVAPPSQSLTVALVSQKYCPVQPWDKKRLLLHLLRHEGVALTVVFCRTKRTVSRVTRYLKDHGIDAYEIHGDLPQGQRNQIMQRLRAGNLEVLIASDLASRGLDVEGISHIINYDLPEDPELYVHRIGRTARAGRSGAAWSLVTPNQGQLLSEIEKLTNVHLDRLEYGDFEASPKPADWEEETEGRPAAAPPPSPPAQSRFHRPVSVPPEADADPQLFPGGVVPKGEPKKTLGSRFRTRRSR